MVFLSIIRILKHIFELITSFYGCLVPRRVRVAASILGHDDVTHRQLSAASTTSRVSSYVKGGLGLMVTATLDLNIAFVTSYWVTWKNKETEEHGGYGMWKTWECRLVDIGGAKYSPPIIPICSNRWIDGSFPGWLLATKILLLFGVLGQTASLIMLLVYAFLPSGFRNRVLMAATIGTNFSAGLLVVVGLCVFGFKVVEGIQDSPESEWFLSYSFSLACTAFVLSAISGSILMTESKRLSQRMCLNNHNSTHDIHLAAYKIKS